ncbi:MAG: hypothetical protein ACRC62_22760 [Microcoleus sp.]
MQRPLLCQITALTHSLENYTRLAQKYRLATINYQLSTINYQLSIDRERGRSHYNRSRAGTLALQLSTIDRSRAGTLALQLSTLNSQLLDSLPQLYRIPAIVGNMFD